MSFPLKNDGFRREQMFDNTAIFNILDRSARTSAMLRRNICRYIGVEIVDSTTKGGMNFALKMVNFALQMMNFALKMVDFALKMVDFALKMMDFTLKRMDFVFK